MADAVIFKTKQVRPAPITESGWWQWARRNLFGSVTNTVITLLCLYVLYRIIPPVVNWALLDATISGADRTACQAAPHGACWTFIKVRFVQLMFGLYFGAHPEDLWRPILAFAILGGMIGWLISPRTPYKVYVALFAMFGFPVLAYAIIEGELLGLAAASTDEWGGFLLTVSLAYVGIVASLPIGIVLALGRRSRLPIIRALSVAYIELWRGAPLVTVLFMASVMLPLFFPAGVEFNKVLRAMIGIMMFESAYAAEVVRGGLSAIPRGQYEAADALGLGYWKKMVLIILPQSLKISIPGIVNTFVSLFKDTSLVTIIGLFDLLNISQRAARSIEWKGYDVEALIFAAVIFWICTFSMSRYSQYVERTLDKSKRK